MRIRCSAAACAALLLGFAASAAAQGNAEVSAEAPDYSPVDMGVELGLFAGGFFPDADEHEFYDYRDAMQEPLESAGPDLGLRAGFYPLRFLGVELEGDLMPFATESGSSVLLYGVRGQVVVQAPGIAANGRFSPFLLGGFGTMGVSSDEEALSDDADKVGHLGIGAKLQLNRMLMARLDGRYYRAPRRLEEGATDDPRDGTNHWAVLAGLSLTLGRPAVEESLPADSDGDGITDDADKCPREAGDPPDGCPKPKDSDGDGIMDDVDRCKTEPETVNSFEDDDGCPDQVPDKDGDGLSDALDSCIDQPEDVDGFEDTDGCPDPDDDKDGVLDAADKCAREAGPVENRGCPDTDRDKDGVVDRLDNCPDEPGTAANHGCKKKQLAMLTQTSIKILDKVYFNTNRATIMKRSNRLLNNVASVVINHPEIPKIRIEGHTDDKGKDDYNKDLSQRRAERVRMYLIEKGVPEDRLEAIGFGEEKPVSSNSTAKGRAANRRVEFNFADAVPVETTVPEPGADTKAPDAPKPKTMEKKDETLKPPP
jgi:outer membrane protein OmpA-like peptidoglycan-associated protein/opacity protein-like surface antigen